jgi:hypothetical protein
VVRQFDTPRNLFVVARKEEFPEVPKSETNPNCPLIGDTCPQISLFKISASGSSRVGWCSPAKSSEARSPKSSGNTCSEVHSSSVLT